MTIIDRPRSPRPPTFKAGSTVIFRDAFGIIHEGIFVRRYSKARNAAISYEVIVDGRHHDITANSEVGLSMTRKPTTP